MACKMFCGADVTILIRYYVAIYNLCILFVFLYVSLQDGTIVTHLLYVHICTVPYDYMLHDSSYYT